MGLRQRRRRRDRGAHRGAGLGRDAAEHAGGLRGLHLLAILGFAQFLLFFFGLFFFGFLRLAGGTILVVPSLEQLEITSALYASDADVLRLLRIGRGAKRGGVIRRHW